MERNQLINRKQYPEMPPRVEYSITEFGRSLGPVLEMLKSWGIEHRTAIFDLLTQDYERKELMKSIAADD